ncbi:MAG: L-2-amino-thiazoline-4-carboxylic acid hydrolase [Solobacterium sp.]|nr:L-2-amino-thiazoline-4-carboxylic acid hydrolase [Solobacterium sp.]
MKYTGMPWGMWILFSGSFRKQLTKVLGLPVQDARILMHAAEKDYRRIIADLPEFEVKDRFKMNIVNCAMLCSVLMNLKEKPSVEDVTVYYRESMMTGPMKWFCYMSGKRKFTEKDLQGMKDTAAFRAADRNPYSWNMNYLPYEDESGYEARFTKCGICRLMKENGLYDYVPAMCRLDYTMSEAGGASDFVRQYTLASGGPYCDCGYRKKIRS